MIYQPRKNGDCLYVRSFPAYIHFETGLVIKRFVKVVIHERFRPILRRVRFVIIAGWDDGMEPGYKIPYNAPVEHQYRGGKINVN